MRSEPEALSPGHADAAPAAGPATGPATGPAATSAPAGRAAGRRRVVHVLTRLSRGGTEENTIATCAGQLELGHDVWLVHGAECQDAIRATVPAGVEIVRVPELLHRIDPIADAKAVLAVRRLLARIDPHVVHTHQSKGGIVGRLATVGLRRREPENELGRGTGHRPGQGAGRRPGPLVVHTVHIAPFLNVGPGQRAVYLVLEHLAARFTDGFISVSAGMMNAYRRYRIGRAERHRVVHSGMALDKYLEAEPPPAWRERIGWEGESRPFIVLMLAAFDRRKRHVEFVEAAGELFERVPGALVCFAGEGHCEAEVRAAVERTGFASRFRFLGHDPHPEELIALADVCTLCSAREGLPRVLVQYVAARRRVVLMRLPGVDELLDGYAGATVVEDGDFPRFVRELVRVHDEEYLPARRAPRFAPVDVERWTTEAMVAGIERVYRALEAESATPGS